MSVAAFLFSQLHIGSEPSRAQGYVLAGLWVGAEHLGSVLSNLLPFAVSIA